jgi:hypothetical protein
MMHTFQGKTSFVTGADAAGPRTCVVAKSARSGAPLLRLPHEGAWGTALCCYAQYRLAIPAELAHMLGPSFS